MSGNLRLGLLLIALVCATAVSAQNPTRSPYSRFGIGEMRYQGFSQHSAMGENSIALRNTRSFTVSNPASYSALSFTSLEAGGYLNFGTLSNSTQKVSTNSSSFSYFALGFPVLKGNKWGAAFGLLPYSNIGYNSSQQVDSSFSHFTNHYSGNGGLTRFFIGNSARIYKQLHAGFNASFLFGQVNNEKYTVFPDSNSLYFDTRQVKSDYVRGLMLDYGLQYSLEMDTAKKLYSVFGLTYQSSANLNLDRIVYSGSTDKGSTRIVDTTYLNENEKGHVRLPSGFSAGYTLQKGDQWLVSVTYSQMRWKEFTYMGASQNLQNSQSFNIGGYIVPNPNAVQRQVLSLTRYYAGFRYKETGLVFNNTHIKETAISAGFSIPTKRVVNASARIHLTGEYIMRGTTSQGLIRENYYRLNFGVTFTDAWFLKRKYE